MNLEDIIVNKVDQAQKEKYCIISLCVESKKVNGSHRNRVERGYQNPILGERMGKEKVLIKE
jgi:hypothetical protein